MNINKAHLSIEKIRPHKEAQTANSVQLPVREAMYTNNYRHLDLAAILCINIRMSRGEN